VLGNLAAIGAAQRVEHYEIAAYGTARTFAERLGNQEAGGLLRKTLEEEKEADEKLSEISGQLLEAIGEAETEPAAEEVPSSGKRGARFFAAAPMVSCRFQCQPCSPLDILGEHS
jgi:hypothetical protein